MIAGSRPRQLVEGFGRGEVGNPSPYHAIPGGEDVEERIQSSKALIGTAE